MKHFAPAEFWQAYRRLPKSVQKLADKNFQLLKQDPSHPSLALKKIGRLRSVRVGLQYRVLAVEAVQDLIVIEKWELIDDETPFDLSHLRDRTLNTRPKLNRAEADNILGIEWSQVPLQTTVY